MLKDKMAAALNKQIFEEFYSSNLYLSMASWCEVQGLNGCAEFMYEHATEEMDHMMRFFRYINEMDGHAEVPALQQPPIQFESIQKIFDAAFDHEKFITSKINDLVALSVELKDYTTQNFLQWFVDEQREEEATFREILDKLKLIGDGPQSLYYIDLEIEKINARAHVEEGGTEE
jgi:ferritin